MPGFILDFGSLIAAYTVMAKSCIIQQEDGKTGHVGLSLRVFSGKMSAYWWILRAGLQWV